MPGAPKSRKRRADPFDAVESETVRRLLSAALEAFAEHGYHATTTRTICSRAGLSSAALYVHFQSKSDLLFAICENGHRHVLREIQAAVGDAATAPAALEAFVRCFGEWHALNHTLARVSQYELGALDHEQLGRIARLRRGINQVLRRVLRDGVDSGDFEVADVPGSSLTILSIGIDVARWYTPKKDRSPARIGALQAELVARMVASSR